MLAAYLKRGWFQRAFGQQRISSRTRIVLVATGSEVELLESLLPELRELIAKRTVAVPPLAARAGDIPRLAEHLLRKAAAKAGKRIPGLAREAIDRLVSYGWPGNVRELKEVVKRAVVVASTDEPIPVGLIFVVPPEKEAYRINLLRRDRLRAVLRHPALTTVARPAEHRLRALRLRDHRLWRPAGARSSAAAGRPQPRHVADLARVVRRCLPLSALAPRQGLVRASVRSPSRATSSPRRAA